MKKIYQITGVIWLAAGAVWVFVNAGKAADVINVE